VSIEKATKIHLAHVDRPGLETSQGVHFPMAYGHRTVRVFVTRAAIMGRSAETYDSCASKFQEGRGFFEILAREKFNAKPRAASVAITAQDLLGQSSNAY
jgi:hypothetical protein